MGWGNVFVYKGHPSVMLYEIKKQSNMELRKSQTCTDCTFYK